MSSDNHRKSFTPELVQSSQQTSWSYVVRQSPQKFHTRTGAKYRSKSHGRMSSDNHRKSFTPELVQSIAVKAMVVCSSDNHHKSFTPELVQSIVAKAMVVCSSDNHRKSFTPELVQSIAVKAMVVCSSDNHRKSFTPELVQSIAVKAMVVCSSDNHRKSFTPELVQSIAVKAMVVCRQTITAKVSHQNWCKVSQQKSWSYVVRQLPQKFHTRTGAKFHSKSHLRTSSDNYRGQPWSSVLQSKCSQRYFFR